MRIVQHRAGHHIIYTVLAAVAGSAIAAAGAGCTQGEEPDGSGGASPDLTAAAAAARTATASPAPRSPASATSAASQTPAASQSGTTAEQTPAQAATYSDQNAGPNAGQSAGPSAARSSGQNAGPSAARNASQSTASADDPDQSDYHIDDQDVEYEIPRRPAHPRKGRTIQIVLRSSPPGAVAAVDGITVGPTPALWEGVVETTPREFTFVLPGYAMARYRFVPTRSGIVHGSLEPIKPEGEDGEQGKRGKRHRPGQAKSAPASR